MPDGYDYNCSQHDNDPGKCTEAPMCQYDSGNSACVCDAEVSGGANPKECGCKKENNTTYNGYSNCICKTAYGIVNDGDVKCQLCPSGSIHLQSNDETEPIKCTTCGDNEISNGYRNVCICPAGYGLQDGKCAACPKGQIHLADSSEQEKKQCSPCPAGTFYDSPTNCIQCPDGTISQGGDSPCIACPEGQVADLSRTSCQEPQECKDIGQMFQGFQETQIRDEKQCACTNGSRVVGVNYEGRRLYLCQPCAAASQTIELVSDYWNKGCIPKDLCGSALSGSHVTDNQCACDEGLQPAWPDNEGLACVKPCAAGMRLHGTDCVPCGDGQWSEAGAYFCTDCLGGQVTNLKMTACVDETECGANTEVVGRHCACTAGHQVSAAGDACEPPCPAGEHFANGACAECPNGSISAAGENVCRPCDTLIANPTKTQCQTAEQCTADYHGEVQGSQCVCKNGLSDGVCVEDNKDPSSDAAPAVVIAIVCALLALLVAATVAIVVTLKGKRSRAAARDALLVDSA